MKVNIKPAYLGFSAGQSERSKRRGITKNIWVMKDGTRIKIKDLNDAHLVRIVLLLDGNVKRMRERERIRAEELSNAMDGFNDIEEDSSLVLDYMLSKTVAGMSKSSILNKTIPCWPALVIEGYKRGLLHSSGFPNQKGLELVGLGKETDAIA